MTSDAGWFMRVGSAFFSFFLLWWIGMHDCIWRSLRLKMRSGGDGGCVRYSMEVREHSACVQI